MPVFLFSQEIGGTQLYALKCTLGDNAILEVVLHRTTEEGAQGFMTKSMGLGRCCTHNLEKTKQGIDMQSSVPRSRLPAEATTLCIVDPH